MQKIVLITGTRKGLGKDLAEYYLSKGFFVVGCSRGSRTISHENYLHFELNVTDEVSVVEMIRYIANKFGRLDYLINNAGIASMNHLILTPLDVAKEIFNTNFFGSFLLIREASKIMIKNKTGRIVNFSTVAVPLKLEGELIYAASKAAIVSLTQIASKELGAFGITVNAIGPTPIKTDLIKAVPKEKIEKLINMQVVKRYGNITDVVNCIDFFIDEKSDFITGQIIYLGGINN